MPTNRLGKRSSRGLWLAVLIAFALGVAGPLVVLESRGGSGPAETRTALDAVVVDHVYDLLSNRFDAAWARLHPDDQRAVGRQLWEKCKRSPDDALATVRYRGVRVLRSKSGVFDSSLHDHVPAVAVTVRVRALLSGSPFQITDVSHWMLDDGRWARLVEPRKLAAYAAGQCPAT